MLFLYISSCAGDLFQCLHPVVIVGMVGVDMLPARYVLIDDRYLQSKLPVVGLVDKVREMADVDVRASEEDEGLQTRIWGYPHFLGVGSKMQ